MKKSKIILTCFLIGLFVVGCSTTNKSHLFTPLSVSVASELEADIDVDMETKLTGVAKANYFLGVFKMSGDSRYADGYGDLYSPVGQVKSAAAYNAISTNGGDILVSPNYVVKRVAVFPNVSIQVEVTGYKGTIKKIR